MPNQVGTSQGIRFATFEVDLQAQELRKGGLRLKLSGQPFQVLAILLEQPGVVVTREELQKRLWPDTFVDVDHNLNTAINKIREMLGDSAENPRFVETLPRRGYRFIAPVEDNLHAQTFWALRRRHTIATAHMDFATRPVFRGMCASRRSRLIPLQAATCACFPGAHANACHL
jgi:DNA-binding winged helix-turn-helix (wHTH) protein